MGGGAPPPRGPWGVSVTAPSLACEYSEGGASAFQVPHLGTLRLTRSAEPTHSPECKFGHLGSRCRSGEMKTVQFPSVKWTGAGPGAL